MGSGNGVAFHSAAGVRDGNTAAGAGGAVAVKTPLFAAAAGDGAPLLLRVNGVGDEDDPPP